MGSCFGRQGVVVLAAGWLLAALFYAALALQRSAPLAIGGSMTGDTLLNPTNVWTVHLRLTPDQWAKMEPAGGPGPFGGGFPPGDPGGPGGADPGPAMVFVPLFMGEGDTNHDGRLSLNEFAGLGGKWFTAWDTNRSGELDSEKIRTGINTTLAALMAKGQGNPGGGGPGAAPPGAPRAPGRMVDFPQVRADLEFAGCAFPDVSLRYKGNFTSMASRGSLKRSLKVDWNDGFPGRRLGGVTKLSFHNNVTDAGWMNEVLAYRLYRDAGVPAPRTAYARVYVTVAGLHDRRYLGLYSLVENVDNTFCQARFGTKKGALFKPLTRQIFEYWGDDWSAYRAVYNPQTPLAREESQRVINFCRLVSQADDAAFAARIDQFLDLEAMARFMAVTVWLPTMDSLLRMGQNYLVDLHPKTGQFQFIPWDLDHAFGQYPLTSSQAEWEKLSIHKPWAGQVLRFDRLFKLERFRRLYLERMREFSETIFNPVRIQQQVDELGVALRCHVYHGAHRDLEAALRGHLVLTTYGTLRGSIEQFLERSFYYVILDESQAIKNSDTQTTQAVLLLKAQHRLALSGTPIENRLSELFSLFRFLNPAMFGSEAEFNRHYALPIHQHDDQDAARELRRKIYPFILRRLKRDVLRDLPEKIEQTLYVDMSPEQRQLYDARRG